MDFSEVVARRYSCRSYQPNIELGERDLSEILSKTMLSPSSYNLQHWRFIVVRDEDRKKALRAAAWDQEQVETCSAVIAVCGALDAHLEAESLFRDVPAEQRETLVPMIHEFYDGNFDLMRDEALRSASLAAMTLMHAAANRGWDSCPMIGFDPEAAAQVLEVPDNWVIAMLVTLGKGTEARRPRRRRPLHEVVTLETADGLPFGEIPTVPAP